MLVRLPGTHSRDALHCCCCCCPPPPLLPLPLLLPPPLSVARINTGVAWREQRADEDAIDNVNQLPMRDAIHRTPSSLRSSAAASAAAPSRSFRPPPTTTLLLQHPTLQDLPAGSIIPEDELRRIILMITGWDDLWQRR